MILNFKKGGGATLAWTQNKRKRDDSSWGWWWIGIWSNSETKNIEKLLNFNQALSEGKVEEGYAPLESIEDNYARIEEEPKD